MYSRLPLWARVTALLLLTWLLFVAESVVVSACSTIRFVDVSAPGYFKRVVNNPYRPAHARLLNNVRFASIFRFISSSVGRWCDPVLAVPVLFIALVDCLVYLVPKARSVVGNAKQHLRLSGVRPGVEALAELGLGPLPVSCGTKKPVCCANVGCPGFLVLSAGQQRQVLKLALAYLRGSRTGVARPLVDTSFVYEALRQLQYLDIYPALRNFTLSSLAVPLSRSNTQELDGASGAVVFRAPVSARTMAQRKYAPVFPPIPKVKANTTSARGPARRPTYARLRPATRMGVTGPLLFSVLSFALLACLLAEHETDARPLDALELANEVATLAPQLDLVLAPGSCPSPARASPSVVKEAGALEPAPMPAIEPAPVSLLTAAQRIKVVGLALGYRQARNVQPTHALANMGLKYLLRSSFYLSSDFATRMGVPLVKASSPARKEQRAPRFAAYLPPALRNGSRTAAHGVAAESSRVAAVQKLDRDTQEMQDARRGDPETRLGSGPATAATVDMEPEEPGAVVNRDAEEAPRKRRTRRGKRAGRPRGQKAAEVDQGQETEMEMGVAPEL